MCGMCRESDLLMKIKTCELKGSALDLAVSRATADGGNDGWGWFEISPEGFLFDPLNECIYSPSTVWEQAGPIIEREKYTITFSDNDWYTGWIAATQLPSAYVSVEGTYIADCLQGSTPLEAAMRLLVARKLGPEVEIPGELL